MTNSVDTDLDITNSAQGIIISIVLERGEPAYYISEQIIILQVAKLRERRHSAVERL